MIRNKKGQFLTITGIILLIIFSLFAIYLGYQSYFFLKNNLLSLLVVGGGVLGIISFTKFMK